MDFARRKLKVGGVLYISYNTFPGWTTLAPMRDLMLQHTETLGVKGKGIPSLVSDALKFARELAETKPLFGQANPQTSWKSCPKRIPTTWPTSTSTGTGNP